MKHASPVEMKKNRLMSRREASKSIGMTAGLSLFGASIAAAAIPTPRQVEGPFHPIDEQADTDLDLTLIDGHAGRATGETILVRGRITGTDGQPLSDALVDIWQANHYGRYSHGKDRNTAPLDPDFQGWGLQRTNDAGQYGFRTIKPGPYPLSFLGEEGTRCRHIHFKVSRPGSRALTTQMYFRGDPLIEQDLEIAKAPKELQHLLIAEAATDAASGLPLYTFDIVLASSGA